MGRLHSLYLKEAAPTPEAYVQFEVQENTNFG